MHTKSWIFWTAKLLDEVATVEEVANLESLIKSDSQLKKRYVSLIMQESLALGNGYCDRVL